MSHNTHHISQRNLSILHRLTTETDITVDTIPELGLSECTSCSLSRPAYYRRYTEDMIIHTVRTMYSTQDHITYVSYGSGMLFFEVRLLSRLFSLGYTRITIILIDPIYNHIISTNAASYISGTYINTTAYDNADDIVQACRTFSTYINEAAYAYNADASVTTMWFSQAEAYHKHSTTDPQLKADILSWIDPDTAVQEHAPFSTPETHWLYTSVKETAHSFILTIDNAHEPILLHHAYASPLEQHQCIHIDAGKHQNTVYCNDLVVLPYELDGCGIQIANQVFTSDNTPAYADSIRCMYGVCVNDMTSVACVDASTRHHVAELISCSAPACNTVQY